MVRRRPLVRTLFALAGLCVAQRVVEAQVVPLSPPPSPPRARFEIAVLAGYRFESTLTFLEPTRYARVEIDNAPTWGVATAYNLNPNYAAEFQYSYSAPAATAIALNPEDPDRSFAVGMHDFQVGLFAYLSDPGHSVRPFLELAVGATVLNSDQSLDEKVQLSLGVSAGVKTYFSDHLGLRAEVHYVPVFLYSTGTDPWVCDDSICWDTGARYLQQVDLRAGLTFRF
jgi:hypothetical protein